MRFQDIAGLKIANTTLEEAADYAISLASGELRGNIVVTPNAEIAAMAFDNPDFCALLNRAELAIPDGIGVVKASKILGTPLQCKVAGVDLATRLLQLAPQYNLSVYILGGKPEVVKKAVENIAEKYPNLSLCGYSDGYFNSDDKAIEKINSSRADIVMCCLGAPKQEHFMLENKERFDAKLLLGVGGSVDVWAGTVKRAPKIFISFGLEWLYRLICQPSRLGRMMKIPGYLRKIKKYSRNRGEQK